MKLMYYESYMADLEEQHNFQRMYSILTGSFVNMDMAQQMISAENPDYESTDDDYMEAARMVLESREKELSKKPRRRRRVINKERHR